MRRTSSGWLSGVIRTVLVFGCGSLLQRFNRQPCRGWMASSAHRDSGVKTVPVCFTFSAVTTAFSSTIPTGLPVRDTTVDLLVVGAGSGMAAALAAHESGLSVLVVEKSSEVGGSTARSGGALWLPASPVLTEADAGVTAERAATYVESVLADTAPAARANAFVTSLAPAVAMLRRTTPMRLFWAKDYSDYHPEASGGSAAGRTCECRPLDTSILGAYRSRLRPGVMKVS